MRHRVPKPLNPRLGYALTALLVLGAGAFMAFGIYYAASGPHRSEFEPFWNCDEPAPGALVCERAPKNPQLRSAPNPK